MAFVVKEVKKMSFTEWDFDNTWAIDDTKRINDGYPYFSMLIPEIPDPDPDPDTGNKWLRFKRIPSSNVVGYKIYEISYDKQGQSIKTYLDTAPNPGTSNLVYYKEKPLWDSYSKYSVPEDISRDLTFPVDVFVDEQKLLPAHYTYSSKLNEVKIIKDTNKNNVIELGYYKDEIEYKVKDVKLGSMYLIKPEFKEVALSGDHNILI